MKPKPYDFKKQLKTEGRNPADVVDALMKEHADPQAVCDVLNERGYDVTRDTIYYYLRGLGYKRVAVWIKS